MVKPELKPGFFFTLCAACLLLPLKLTAAWFLAALVHELGHYFALRATGTRIYSICVGALGAAIETEPMTQTKTLICSLAGPIFGLLLLFFARWYPLLAICAFIQSCFNLLPLFPMDGGRVLRCLLQKLPGSLPSIVAKIVETLILALLSVFSIYLTFRLLLGPPPVLAVLFLWLRRKFSCKQNCQRVQ